MTERAKYACDKCRARKATTDKQAACSRDTPTCRRCREEGQECSYSRSGVIRRSKKGKQSRISSQSVTGVSSHPGSREVSPDGQSCGLRQPNDQMTGSTHERLQLLAGRDCPALKAIAALLEEYTATWQGSAAFDSLAEGSPTAFFLFDGDEARQWVDTFIKILQKEQLLVTSPPSELLAIPSHPDQVDRTWLVMFYSITLHTAANLDDSTRGKLKGNLWLAFNDVRLLLEPNVLSIQALVLMACYAEQFMTPSLCWSLVNKACTMLQALGITHWRLDTATRERRILVFWRLNIMDKSLALILNRPPAFHRQLVKEIPMPTLNQLLTISSPSSSPSSIPALFSAHYMHQMHLLSVVMADLWHCMFGRDSSDADRIKENLDSWYRQAREVLEAAATAEKPLLNEDGIAGVELSLQTFHLYYYYLLVYLTVSAKHLRTNWTSSALKMLSLTKATTNTITIPEPYPSLLWPRIHCPLTAFGTLWGEAVVKSHSQPEQSQRALDAIQHFPAFLATLASRNPTIAKLAGITERILEEVKNAVDDKNESEAVPEISFEEQLNGLFAEDAFDTLDWFAWVE
ncbi:hypothetical protein ASPZODRAFT_145886 [Penicilliopsis zonata CBS 506.65]|uniref:Zn(2)-C6 fungal-type domain-containing protein n=1 Tax=Penicilliopsis zonata CBS 506.65 TaxID=1073090 RepID=A0A1L9S8P3_9EURO|nr:hypothetical protein ASPZODRAFT_145886 [Penicilliopsis zonata CBS 506.65]OJJ43531.1 hypothetical protein ASPZODRAFT_145886 [Penicilliopsis zonata CBS 506.65]